MNTQYLKQYAKILKKKLAYDAILKDIQPAALKELKKHPDNRAIVSDVEFHITFKNAKQYPESVTEKINQIREDAVNSGKVKTLVTTTFDAQIPKSVKEKVLAQVTDYKKHFSL